MVSVSRSMPYLRPAWLLVATFCCALGCSHERLAKTSPSDHRAADGVPAARSSDWFSVWPWISLPLQSDPITDNTPGVEVSHSDTLPIEDDAAPLFEPTISETSAEPPALEPPCDKYLTLRRALAITRQHNPELEVYRQRIRQAQAQRTVAFAPYLPKLLAAAETVHTNVPITAGAATNFIIGFPSPGVKDFHTAELQLQWTVFDFGRRFGRYRAAAAEVDVAELQRTRALQTASFDTTVAYFVALRTKAMMDVADQAVRRAESVIKIAQDRLNWGATIRDEVLLADLQLASAKEFRVEAETDHQVALLTLNRQMGINPNCPTTVIDNFDRPTVRPALAEYLNLAGRSRRELFVARQEIAIARNEKLVAKADFLPTVTMGGTAINIEGDQLPSSVVLLGDVNMVWNLFEGGKHLGHLQERTAEVAIAVARAKQVALDVAWQVSSSFRRMDDARARIRQAEAAVESAAENYRVFVDRFRQGSINGTELVIAETAFAQSQRRLLEARFDYRISEARLVYAVGADRYDTTPCVTQVTLHPIEVVDDEQ